MNDLPTLYVQDSVDIFVSNHLPESALLHVAGAPFDGSVAYVPAARLDAANLEIAKANEKTTHAVWMLEEAQRLFAELRSADAIASWACESDPDDDSFDQRVRKMLKELDAITGLAARQRAALTPKEPSDG